jgi:peptide/nickel transport system permease protein
MKNITFSYVIKRLGSALLTLWIALTVNFALPRIMGGNPADFMASQTAMGSLEYAKILKSQFGLDKSIFEQYFIYLGQLLKGNLGISYSTFPVPVADIITRAMPWTLLIVIVSVFISFLIAFIVGVICALKKNSWFDNIVTNVAFYIKSIPYFWVAMLMLMGLSYYLDIFPMSHAMPSNLGEDMKWFQMIIPIAYHAFLPILSLVIVTFAGRLIVFRSNVLQVFSEDYIIMGQAKGLKRKTILYKYALRNALLPSFTGLMLSLGLSVGGAMATEIIFSYPGIGLTIMNAIYAQDYPLIQGCFAIIAVSVVGMNFLADLIYPLIDPRVVV